jgi:hypothetical protein
MVLTRELLGRKRYLSVPSALVLSVALRSARARLSVPWPVHWVGGLADGSPERAGLRHGEVRLDPSRGGKSRSLAHDKTARQKN